MHGFLRSHTKILILTAVSLALAALFALPGVDADASFTASLTCDGTFCEASPVNSTYDYGWRATGSLYIPSSCGGSFFCHVGCSSAIGDGTVTVTVTAPNGSSDSASRYVQCR